MGHRFLVRQIPQHCKWFGKNPWARNGPTNLPTNLHDGLFFLPGWPTFCLQCSHRVKCDGLRLWIVDCGGVRQDIEGDEFVVRVQNATTDKLCRVIGLVVGLVRVRSPLCFDGFFASGCLCRYRAPRSGANTIEI